VKTFFFQIKRNYNCAVGNAFCEGGNFQDKVYLTAYVNHCFGVNALNVKTIQTFLSLLKSGQNGWRVPLQVGFTQGCSAVITGRPTKALAGLTKPCFCISVLDILSKY